MGKKTLKAKQEKMHLRYSSTLKVVHLYPKSMEKAMRNRHMVWFKVPLGSSPDFGIG